MMMYDKRTNDIGITKFVVLHSQETGPEVALDIELYSCCLCIDGILPTTKQQNETNFDGVDKKRIWECSISPSKLLSLNREIFASVTGRVHILQEDEKSARINGWSCQCSISVKCTPGELMIPYFIWEDLRKNATWYLRKFCWKTLQLFSHE